MSPLDTLARLKRAQMKAQEYAAAHAAKAAAEAAAERAEAERLAKIEADERAARQAEKDKVDAANAEVERLQAELEEERVAALWAETLAHPALATLWDRVDAAAALLAASPHGKENLRVRSSIALERATGIASIPELWDAMSQDLAGITLKGLEFRCYRANFTADPGIGFGDVIKINTPTGFRIVNSPVDLAKVVAENPTMRWEA